MTSALTTAGVTPAPPQPQATRRAATLLTAIVLVLALPVSIVAAVLFGPADLQPSEVMGTIWAHLTGGDPVLSLTRDAIVWESRMPRVLTAAAVGGGLAVAGAVMQSLTRNPLADPYLLGLSSGASTGAVLVLVLGASIALPFAAFAGALLALLLTLALARAAGAFSPTTIILAGLAVSAVLSALTSLVIFWSAGNDTYREMLAWLLGSMAGANWADAALVGLAVAICAVPMLASARSLDALVLGDTAATALGVAVPRLRLTLFVVTALLTGALVSASGSIGFIGLILPHAVRAVVGAAHRIVLPLSFLAGAVFMVWADTVARTMFDPRELPVGIVTALIGGPVFAILMMRMRGQRR